MTSALAAHQVSFSYGRQRVLDHVGLHVAAGETVGLRGPPAAAKSTLARILVLLHAPDTGHVTLDGQPVAGVRHRLPAGLCTLVTTLF